MISRSYKPEFTLIFISTGLFLLLMALIGGCTERYPELNLKPPEDIDTVAAPTPQYHPQAPFSFGPEAPFVRFAIAPVVAPVQAREEYRGLLTYFPEQFGRPIEMVLRPTHAEINQLLRQNLVDIALVGSYSYLELEASGDVELLAVPKRNGRVHHNAHIIVPEESKIKTLEDLRGRRFVFTDSLSFPGKLYTVRKLEELGETPASFFSDYIFSYSHENSIIAVAEEWVDAASVCSLVYEHLVKENPELEDRIRIIESSPPVGNPPLVINSSAEEEFKRELEEFFLSMHEDSQGREALEEMRIEEFVPGVAVDYNRLRQMFINPVGGD